MKMSLPTELFIGAYAPLTPSRHLNIPREKHTNEFSHHRRKESLPFDLRSSLRSIQNLQNNTITHMKSSKPIKRITRKGTKADKSLTSQSPKVTTMKSLSNNETYSKRLSKSTIHHPKFGTINMLKTGKFAKEGRNNSVGNHNKLKVQKKSSIGQSTSKHKKNNTAFLKNKRNSNEFLQLLYHGLEKLKNRDMNQAIEYFNKIIELSPNSPEAYFNRGIAYFESDMTTKALSDFEKVSEKWPKYNKSTYLYLSMIYVKISDVNSAISSVLFY